VADRLLTARDVADQLGVSAETVLRWTRRGELPAIRLPGGAIRYRVRDLDAWLEERATPQRGVLATPPGAARPLEYPPLATPNDEEDCMNTPYACTVCAGSTTTGFGVQGPAERIAAGLMYAGLTDDDVKHQLRDMLNGMGRLPDRTDWVQVPLCRDCAKRAGAEVGELAAPAVPFYNPEYEQADR
jgi:excisionase family DNA binding protein